MLRSPLAGLNAQSNTGRCSGLRPGAPSMVSFWSRNWTMPCASVVL